jgi:Protein of unknown function (DUF2939)
MRKLHIVLALLPLGALVWLYRLPYQAADRMAEALRTGNKADLEDTIDFEALRRSLKEELSATMMASVRDSKSEEQVGAAIASALIGGLGGAAIDMLLTPAHISTLIQTGAADPSARGKGAAKKEIFADATYEYRSLQTFVVRTPSDSGFTECMFKREGLSWKLAGIQLPRKP